MPTQNLSKSLQEKHFRLIQKQSIERQETDREINEALRSGSATNFWRLANGLNTFGGAQ
jgi:transcriptional regulator with AAA-type ATPase domain